MNAGQNAGTACVQGMHPEVGDAVDARDVVDTKLWVMHNGKCECCTKQMG